MTKKSIEIYVEDLLSEVSVLELAELIECFEEKFKVKANIQSKKQQPLKNKSWFRKFEKKRF